MHQSQLAEGADPATVLSAVVLAVASPYVHVAVILPGRALTRI